MQLGASLPVGDIGTGPSVVRDYAQTLEGLGFDYIQAPDHVLGGNPEGHKDKTRVGTSVTAYHDPFVLFSFIAGCTSKIGFAPGVLILAQRQAVLVAKQAASLDELSNGRLRLGIGVGWNVLEFTGLNEELPQSRQAVGGTGSGDAGAVGQSACGLQGQVSHDR